MVCSCRAAQELEDKRPEPLQAATTLDLRMVEGNMAVGYPPVVVMEEVLPPEGLMDRQLVEDPTDTPTLGDPPLELQEDCMVERPQGAPMVSRLRIPTGASILGLMDRDLLQVSRDLGLQVQDLRPCSEFSRAHPCPSCGCAGSLVSGALASCLQLPFASAEHEVCELALLRGQQLQSHLGL